MKILALNSSARVGRDSKTQIMLDALVEGMKDAGADVEVVNLKDKKIKVCAGCFACWSKTPGKCIQKDDMSAELFDKWIAADLCVYATPLFHHTVNATMKAFIERTLPAIKPYLIKESDRWSHPMRYDNYPGAVILSVCGFPEVSAFDALKHYAKYLFWDEHGGLWGEIYRAGAETLPLSSVKDEILAATRKAGKELVENKKISPETQAKIEQPIVSSMEDYACTANMFWDTCIDEGVSPREFDKKGLRPRPKDIKGFLLLMGMGFNPVKAGDTNAVMQFDFSGQVNAKCHLAIKEGKITCTEGAADAPDLTVITPFDIWMDIMTGKADGGESFMAQKYTAEGNMDLLLKMDSFFGPDE